MPPRRWRNGGGGKNGGRGMASLDMNPNNRPTYY
jgi:hypothetical protein